MEFERGLLASRLLADYMSSTLSANLTDFLLLATESLLFYLGPFLPREEA